MCVIESVCVCACVSVCVCMFMWFMKDTNLYNDMV